MRPTGSNASRIPLTGSNTIQIGPRACGTRPKLSNRSGPGGSSQPHKKGSDRVKRGDNECSICSYKQLKSQDRGPVQHCHFSSKYDRKQMGADPGSRYMCPSCKVPHRVDPENRTKVVVSDSTLHMVFDAVEFAGDSIHMDYITIRGGTIEENCINIFNL